MTPTLPSPSDYVRHVTPYRYRRLRYRRLRYRRLPRRWPADIDPDVVLAADLVDVRHRVPDSMCAINVVRVTFTPVRGSPCPEAAAYILHHTISVATPIKITVISQSIERGFLTLAIGSTAASRAYDKKGLALILLITKLTKVAITIRKTRCTYHLLLHLPNSLCRSLIGARAGFIGRTAEAQTQGHEHHHHHRSHRRLLLGASSK